IQLSATMVYEPMVARLVRRLPEDFCGKIVHLRLMGILFGLLLLLELLTYECGFQMRSMKVQKSQASVPIDLTGLLLLK
ncbi:MAG: hypothetical protein QMB38_07990, partial [Ascidiaceihabitans sp.]